MLFVISAPRSGSTMLERMLESHSQIVGGPESHILTPLAHLGVWNKVDKAPYDHVLAAQAQRTFVDQLPGKDQDYWDACRAYCDVLYGRYLASSGKRLCLDKTPAYALILPFIMKVFPDAKYVVLTRHPIATFSSYANSFFDGDYAAAQAYNPLLRRYVPALAAFLRQTTQPFLHLRYEDLVSDPEERMRQVYDYLELPFEAATIDYGDHSPAAHTAKGLGDPIGVAQHSRPTTDSLSKWADELAASPEKRGLMEKIIAALDPEDLSTLGYPLQTLWEPLETISDTPLSSPKLPLTRYRLQRKLIIRLRAMAQGGLFRRLLEKARLVCDVLLRE